MTDKQAKGTRALTKEISIDAAIQTVWNALTEADELIRWFPMDAKVRPGTGGSVWMSWRNEYQFSSAIEIWEPNKHLRLLNTPSDQDAANQDDEKKSPSAEPFPLPSPVAFDYYLESRGKSTILRLVHSGFSKHEDWDALFDATSRGWDYQLWGLKHYLEHHLGKRRGMVYVRHFINDYTRKDAWERLWSSDGVLMTEKELRAGQTYDFNVAKEMPYRGTVQSWNPPNDFIATVDNLNNATLRIQLEHLFGKRDLTVTFSTYGLADAQVESLKASWSDLLRRLLPA